MEATVLDLTSGAARLGDAVALVTRACQSRLTSPAKLSDELRRRRTQRWRRHLLEAVSDAAEGAHSLLELRYLRDVERAHGLPAGRRQKAVANTFQDVSYDGFATVVELDGRLGHADTDGRWRDMTRDNATAARGETALRYGWADVTTRPCAVAAQVVRVLRARGWSGTPRKCADSCEL